MRNTKNINPIEIAFHSFIDEYPESYNPKDRKRFYEFVNTLNTYKREGKKWFEKEYFIKRLSKYVSLECSESYYSCFEVINDYKSLKPASVNKVTRYIVDDERSMTYEIRFIKNGKLFVKTVDCETFEKTNSLKRASELPPCD